MDFENDDDEKPEDDIWVNPTYYQDLVDLNAKKKKELLARLKPVTDLSRAWVVYSVEQQENQQYLELAPVLSKDLKYLLSDTPAEEASIIMDSAFQALRERTGGRIIKKIQQAAFTNRELAEMVANYLPNSEGPVEIHVDSLSVTVNRFKEEVLDGKRPYDVFMLRGKVRHVRGYQAPNELEVHKITEVTFSEDDKRLYGTFWAWDFFLAEIEASNYWNRLNA